MSHSIPGHLAIPLATALLFSGCATNRQYHGPYKSAKEQMAQRATAAQTAATPAKPATPENPLPRTPMGRQLGDRPATKAPSQATAAKPAPGPRADDRTNLYDIRVDNPHATEGCRMGFVEFDDMGGFWNANQLVNVLDDIKKQDKIILFIFIHGWQNSARVWGDLGKFDPEPEGDVQRFKNFLLTMANMPMVKASGRKVYGVFLGWRGELVVKGSDPVSQQLLRVPRFLTFWSRRSAATRMGDAASMGATLMALREAGRPNPIPKPDDPILVFMGHSFGSKVLEQAVAQWMAREAGERIARAGSDRAITIPRFADLVLFLNSAGESIYTRRIRSLLPDREDFHKMPPYFISVTSETDTATKIAFPIATTIGTALGSFQKFATEGVSSSLFFRRTTPFNQFMLNGQVDRVPDVAWRLPGEIYEADPKERIQPVVDKNCPDYFQQMLQTVQFNAAVKDDKGPGAYRIYGTDGTVSQITILDPKEHPDVKNRSGFWVFRVEKNIMNGHSDIWNLNAIILYTKLFRLSCPRRVDGTQVEFPGYDPYVIEAKLQPDL